MDSKLYICKYCHREFTPTRRHVQKFCSDSCRSKSHHIKNRITVAKLNKNVPSLESNKIDTMSMAGVGNATAGSLAADALKSILTTQDNKPATKGDIKVLLNRMGRYQKVINLPLGENGALPHFDMETNNIVYLPNSLIQKMMNNKNSPV